VVTCLVVGTTEPDHADAAHATLVDTGASIVWHTAEAVVAAYRRVTDAVRAALELQTDLPASRVALSTGETDARGECTAVAAKAHLLLSAANPGATLLSKLAGALAMDHLPRGRTLAERVGSAEPCYELRTA
jgi:hypothetical protein